MLEKPIAEHEIDLDSMPEEFWEELSIPRNELEGILEMQYQLEARAPKIGAPAPDFRLERLDRQGQPTGQFDSLANQRGTPVALLFGSYT